MGERAPRKRADYVPGVRGYDLGNLDLDERIRRQLALHAAPHQVRKRDERGSKNDELQ